MRIYGLKKNNQCIYYKIKHITRKLLFSNES